MNADKEMPRHSNAEDRTVDMSLKDKTLTPWLAQRFTDRARPLAPQPTVGMTAFRLRHLDRQRGVGHSNDRLAWPATSGTGRAFATRPVHPSPIAARVSDFVLRKLTRAQAGWQQALSLPLVQRLRRSRSAVRRDAPPDMDRAPCSEQDHPVGKTVRVDAPVTERSLSPTVADRLTPSSMSREYAETARMLHDGDSDTSGSVHGSPGPTESGGIYRSDRTRDVVTQQVDTPHEAGTQVRPKLQHPDLAHRVVRAATRVTRQTGLQRSFLQPRPGIISPRIPGQEVASTPDTHHQQEASQQPPTTVTPEQAPAPLETGLPATQQAGGPHVYGQPTLLDITAPKDPGNLLSRAFGDLQRSLIRLGRQDPEWTRPERATGPGIPSKQGATISRSSALGVPRSPEFGAVSYSHAPQPSVETSQMPAGEAVISRSMGGREMYGADIEQSDGLHRVPTEAPAQEGAPHGHVSPVTRSVIRSAPMIPINPRAISMPLRRLFRAVPDTPAPTESEDRGSPHSRDYEPSSPGYTYAHQAAPALPVVSRVSPGADSTAAGSSELFRYTSDDTPQIGHSGNHNGLDLPLATVNRAAETRTESETTVPDLPKDNAEEKQATPDIRALAREVYPLIKRMIMIERDRHPTWY